MHKQALIFMTFFCLVLSSYAASQSSCDYVQASLSNIKNVVSSYGAKSFMIESKKDRLNANAVSFSFVDSQGQAYLGVNHVDRETCQTEFYNIQKSMTINLN